MGIGSLNVSVVGVPRRAGYFDRVGRCCSLAVQTVRGEKEMSAEPSPYVLPTYQAVLNRTIASVIEQLNSGDPLAFYRTLRTLIRISPPVAKKDCEEDMAKLLDEVNRANKVSGIDLYWARDKRNERVKTAIIGKGPPLFEKLMESLHVHGFLLKTPLTPRHKTKSKFGMP